MKNRSGWNSKGNITHPVSVSLDRSSDLPLVRTLTVEPFLKVKYYGGLHFPIGSSTDPHGSITLFIALNGGDTEVEEHHMRLLSG